MSLRGIAGFYTDYLWFDSLGLSAVWNRVLTTGRSSRWSVIFTLAVLRSSAGEPDDRRPARAGVPADVGPEDDLIERYHEMVGPRARLVRIGVGRCSWR